ncbi:MAG: acetoacetate--CoA ligase [Actinomycetota bacterium]|jgi:acetoacetyl-CoA synthetase|nr:acetoacetate--CoA ligase [Actinomycetota bacterium]
MPAETPEVLWRPPQDVREASVIGRYLAWLEQHRELSFSSYEELWEWSVSDLEGFWSSMWEFFEVDGTAYQRVLSGREMPGVRWFAGATLNYAEHALRTKGERVMVSSLSQTRGPQLLTADELRNQVACARAGLQRLGVKKGDRVAAYLPNISEALVAFLAGASLGAVWSSCAPEFGTRSVVDRFAQIDPKVLLVVDGYSYGSKTINRSNEVAEIRAALPGLESTVVVPYSGRASIPDTVTWEELLSEPSELDFDRVPFDHPLYVLYSSGTTGLPKPIVHGHGGILLEHLKVIGLHADLGDADRFLWFSTTGWMMWNFCMSGLLVSASVVCFDGNPAHPDLMALWRLVEQHGVTYFGSSAPFLLSCRKAGIEPGRELDLSRLRSVGSTGAPLPPEGFHWVYEHVSRNVLLSSTSGGTDVCTAFVGAVPLVEVRAGEIPVRNLGCKVEAFDEQGNSVIGRRGELVITEPMPSMPVSFWGDDDGTRYREAYFEQFEGVWRHGDWITITERGSCEITGRSDATLNRGGVRLGTSEFYSVVEGVEGVAESLVIHLEDDSGSGRLLLFVALEEGAELDDELRARISSELRTHLSPRHVPDAIHQVPDVPRTLSNKKLEVPVKKILMGASADEAASKGALANPDSLDAFEHLSGQFL